MDKKRKIAICFSVFFIISGFIISQLGIKWSIALIIIQIFFFSGLIVAPLMSWHSHGKQAYDLYGGITAYLLLHLILYLWYPSAFEFVTFMNAFWVFESLFLIVNCALLGKTSFTIFSTNAATFVFMIMALCYIFTQFTEQGHQIELSVSNKIDLLMKNVVLNQTNKAETYNKAIKMKELYKKALSVTKKAKKQGLDVDTEDILREIQADTNIISPEKKSPSPSRRQIVVETIDLPANTIVKTKSLSKNGDRTEIEKTPPDYHSYYWIVEDDKKTKINLDYFAGRTVRCPKEGNGLILQGDPHKDLKLTIKIIPGYYLNHR